MKRSLRAICVILVLSMVMAFPTYAEVQNETRASAYFSSYGTTLYKTSSTSFQVWFDVAANAAIMDRIGVSEIIIYRSKNQSNWIRMITYTMGNYPEMTDYNTYSHTGYVTYDIASPGYYYRAYVTFYAKNSIGHGEQYVFTQILDM